MATELTRTPIIEVAEEDDIVEALRLHGLDTKWPPD